MQLTEHQIRGLCLKSREIFLSQPILLELEAPLKICGKLPRSRQQQQLLLQYYYVCMHIVSATESQCLRSLIEAIRLSIMAIYDSRGVYIRKKS